MGVGGNLGTYKSPSPKRRSLYSILELMPPFIRNVAVGIVRMAVFVTGGQTNVKATGRTHQHIHDIMTVVAVALVKGGITAGTAVLTRMTTGVDTTGAVHLEVIIIVTMGKPGLSTITIVVYYTRAIETT